MINSILLELEERMEYLAGDEVTTIYFGGGTPSLLSIEDMKAITSSLRSGFSLSENLEFTIETNPDDISDESLKAWRELGVNRLSIGTQSFRQKDLDWMNRAHSVQESISSIQRAKEAGFNNISIDLIYGLPDQDTAEWRKQLQQAVDLDVPHLSCYCLTVEDRTALKKWVEVGKLKVPEDDLQSEHFKVMKKVLEEAGYEHYEISNFAKTGYVSKHNSAYWKGEKYLGIGPSAHSFDGKIRRWNISNNQQYMKLISSDSYFEEEVLSAKDRFNEMILTGLRTSDGVELSQLESVHIIPLSVEQQMDHAVQKGWVINAAGRIKLNGDGWLMADHIASSFFIV